MDRGRSAILDDEEAQAKEQRALQAQFEALGVDRRQRISEDDFKENMRATPKASTLEVYRRVNQRGTAENRVTNGIRQLLSSWTNAWTDLSNDDAAREALQDINAGQTHRANLAQRVAQPADQQQNDGGDISNLVYRDSKSHRGGRGRGSGRGGGHMGSRAGRHGPARVPLGLATIDEVPSSMRASGNSTTRIGQPEGLAPSARLNGDSAMPLRSHRNVVPPKEPTAARHRPDQTSSHPLRKARRTFEPSLADPETFMAAARRNKAVKEPVSIALKVIPVVVNEGTNEIQAPASQADKMPESIFKLEQSPKTEAAPTEAPVRAPSPREQLHASPKHLRRNDSEEPKAQQPINSDIEALQKMKDTAGLLSGIFREQMLSHIEQLEASIVSRLTKSPKVTQATPVVKPSAQAATPVVRTSALATAPAQTDITETTKATPIVKTSAQDAGPVVTKSALAATSIHKPVPTISIGITAMKQKTVKIGAIFGEHIQKDHFHAREQLESVDSSVASTTDGIRSVSAEFSQLTLRERTSSRQPASVTPVAEPATLPVEPPVTHKHTMRESPRIIDNAITRQYSSLSTKNASTPQPAVQPTAPEKPTVTHKHTMRETPRLIDSSVTRQYSSQTAQNIEPVYASTNPFAQQSVTTGRSRASSRTTSTTQQSPQEARRDTSPFRERFDTVPYRWVENPARAARSSIASITPKPKIPDFLRNPHPGGEDVGGAARRQYGGGSAHTDPQPQVLTESTNRQVHSRVTTPTTAKPITSSTHTPSMAVSATSRGSVSMENERSLAKKDPWAPARRPGLS